VTRGGSRPGAGRKPQPDALTARVTVRLREDDLGWLASRGAPGEVLRELIADERDREFRCPAATR
jgi:hypothetical protein